MADYRWEKGLMADQILVRVYEESEEFVARKPLGYIMRSGPTAYTAWLPNDTGSRMEFFSMDEAKAWVFTQVRMDDGTALLRTDSLR